MIIAGIALAVVLILARHARSGPEPPAMAFAILIAHVERQVVRRTAGPVAPLSDVVIAASLGGPPVLRVAGLSATAPGRDRSGGRLDILRSALACPPGDRLCVAAAALERSGMDPLAALGRLRRGEAARAQLTRRSVAVRRLMVVGRWTMLTPLVAVATRTLAGGDAVVVAGVAVAAWWLAGVERPARRVFADGPLPAPVPRPTRPPT